jgi:nitrogen-specific signal transduction histidine kinase
MPPTPPMPSWIEDLAEALVRPRARQELARLVDSLPRQVGMRLDRRLVDLARLADDAVAAVRALCPDRDYWVFHEPPALPVLGDPQRLREAIEELVSAAARAAQAGRRVAVRSRIERAPGGPRAGVEIEVEGDVDGSALGPCAEIVRLHGGGLELEARKGHMWLRIGVPLLAGPREGAGA